MKEAIQQLRLTTRDFLHSHLARLQSYDTANELLYSCSGVKGFFNNQSEFLLCKDLVRVGNKLHDADTRREYGDFQTSLALAEQVCDYLLKEEVAPECLVEPTFGKGAFLLAALKHFPTLRYIYGVEIYEPYVWFSKFAVLQNALGNPTQKKPIVELFHDDVFNFDFRSHIKFEASSYLILGNPPWITNSELGSIGSQNLPQKKNFKNFGGFDALTGKSNFDISEYITLMLLDAFASKVGHIAFLLKNRVIQNIVYHLPDYPYQISNLKALAISTKKHFDASVEASLFVCTLGTSQKATECCITNLDAPDLGEKVFGWVSNNFVSDIEAYNEAAKYDGRFPMIWRQGIKHDCSKVMELRADKEGFINGLKQKLTLEDDLIFPLAKSADLRQPLVRTTRKFVIVTQQTIGEDTETKLKRYPKLFSYLLEHKEWFERRKSSVYNNRPPFSIFGIGSYSFKPFKIAVSGFYKDPLFSLVLPIGGKPVMTDDTCYFLGFDELTMAIFTWAALNSGRVTQLLKSIAFDDSKRPFTKQLLMRINLSRVLQDISFSEVQFFAVQVDPNLAEHISVNSWVNYCHTLEEEPSPVVEQLRIITWPGVNYGASPLRFKQWSKPAGRGTSAQQWANQ